MVAVGAVTPFSPLLVLSMQRAEAASSSTRGSGWAPRGSTPLPGSARRPEPPGAPCRGAEGELGHCQRGHFDRAAPRYRIRGRRLARVRVGVRVRLRVGVRVRLWVRVRVQVRARIRVRVSLPVLLSSWSKYLNSLRMRSGGSETPRTFSAARNSSLSSEPLPSESNSTKTRSTSLACRVGSELGPGLGLGVG
eukprot:scaffold8056_cov37-Phaeocystis_antarctica.AAC.1